MNRTHYVHSLKRKKKERTFIHNGNALLLQKPKVWHNGTSVPSSQLPQLATQGPSYLLCLPTSPSIRVIWKLILDIILFHARISVWISKIQDLFLRV